MSHTILLVDDHKIFREGLRALIEQHEGLQVIAEAEDGRAAGDGTATASSPGHH